MSVQDYKLQQGKFWVYIRKKKNQCKDDQGAMFVQRGCGSLYQWRFPGFDWRRPSACSSNFEFMPIHKAGGTFIQLFHSSSCYLWPIVWEGMYHIFWYHVRIRVTRRWQNEQRKQARQGLSREVGVPSQGCGVTALDSARLAWENRSWTGGQELLPAWRLDAD